MSAFYYDIYEEYSVDMFDQVEVDIDGCRVDAVVTAIMPRKRALRVRYDIAREFLPRGARARRTATVPVSKCNLVRRDG